MIADGNNHVTWRAVLTRDQLLDLLLPSVGQQDLHVNRIIAVLVSPDR
jgi:hypothetical protein